MKKHRFLTFLTVTITALSLYTVSHAAEKKTATDEAAVKKTKAVATTAAKMNIGMVSGTIASVDNSDPANIKLSIKNDADEATHVVSVTPWTNIQKVVDASELKIGETIRAMTRKVDDKDVAMGIMFGKGTKISTNEKTKK